MIWLFPDTPSCHEATPSLVFSYTVQPPSPPKSMWSISGCGSALRMLGGKLIPGGLARKGQRKWIAVHYRENPVLAVPVGVSGRAGREAGRSDWAPYSPFLPGSLLTTPREKGGMVELPQHIVPRWQLAVES